MSETSHSAAGASSFSKRDSADGAWRAYTISHPYEDGSDGITWCVGYTAADGANVELADWLSKDTADLISAAPDLLSVVKFFLCIDWKNFTEHDELLLESVKEDAAAACAKATGT